MVNQKSWRESKCYKRQEFKSQQQNRLNERAEKMKRVLLIFAFGVFALSSCSTTKPLKSDKATAFTEPVGGMQQAVLQSGKPAQIARQDQKTVTTGSYTSPVNSRIEEIKVIKKDLSPAPVRNESVILDRAAPTTNLKSVVSAASPVVIGEEKRANIELRGQKKNTNRDTSEKTISWKGIMGNKLLIFGGGALALGGCFFLRRHGKLRRSVDAKKDDQLFEKTWRNL
jgi:hypothetical protein